MAHAALIERELAAAETAWKDSNEGKARVCARRAMALATEAWLACLPAPSWRGMQWNIFVSFSRQPPSLCPSARRLSD